MNWRVKRANPRTFDEGRARARRYMSAEPVDEPVVPQSEFTRETVRMIDESNLISSVRGWDLELRQRTPDLRAIREFMNVRFRHDKDDVEHEDPFEPASKRA